MKALSLTQPMAWAIFNGKDVENRTWNTHFRGRVYIHASMGFNVEHYNWILDHWVRLGLKMKEIPKRGQFIHGAIIGEVDIVSVVKNSGSRWFFGPYAFVLRSPVIYKNPIPCKGSRLFFEPNLVTAEGERE